MWGEVGRDVGGRYGERDGKREGGGRLRWKEEKGVEQIEIEREREKGWTEREREG